MKSAFRRFRPAFPAAGNPTMTAIAVAARFSRMIGQNHDDLNAVQIQCGERLCPAGQYIEASSRVSLLLCAGTLKHSRSRPLAPARCQASAGCVRQDGPHESPESAANRDGPLVHVSFAGLGAGDTVLLNRVFGALAGSAFRALVNGGDCADAYGEMPPNVVTADWFAQPSLIPQGDAVVHHVGNSPFTECAYFARPSAVMPYVWDGHDKAARLVTDSALQ